MSYKKIIKNRVIGKSKKTLFDILTDKKIITRVDAATVYDLQTNALINVEYMINVLSGIPYNEKAHPNQFRMRLHHFKNRSQEKPQRKIDEKGRKLIYKYSAEQQLKLVLHLKETAKKCLNAAKEIEKRAKLETDQNETYYYLQIDNQFAKKKPEEKLKVQEKNIFGNVIK